MKQPFMFPHCFALCQLQSGPNKSPSHDSDVVFTCILPHGCWLQCGLQGLAMTWLNLELADAGGGGAGMQGNALSVEEGCYPSFSHAAAHVPCIGQFKVEPFRPHQSWECAQQ